MPKIKSIEKKNVEQLREEINNALAKLGNKHGLEIKLGGSISYNAFSANAKIEMSVVGGTKDAPIAMTKDAQNFNSYKHRYELTDSNLGDEFTMQGERWKIVGCKPRSKNSILCEKVTTGEIYKVSPRMVKNAIRANK
jgi:hypothetical protein